MFMLIYLILLSSGTVKSDKSEYYVIEMPLIEMHRSKLIKPFKAYWNVPTMQCKSKGVLFEDLHAKYGILQNENDSFRGERITILYDPGIFPALLKNESSGEFAARNGGVPQEGDLSKHLAMFQNVLEASIPDKQFKGIGVIDFESWRPVFRQNFGTLQPYKDLSYEIEKKKHFIWPPSWIMDDAVNRFEDGARSFMQSTISLAKKLRPNALWGYYAYPYCFNMGDRNMKESCAEHVSDENDRIPWLWAESTSLHPSLYSSRFLSTVQLQQLVRGRIREANRIARDNSPVYPYFWYKYRDGEFFSEKDLTVVLDTLYKISSPGIIIWGSSQDVNTKAKCIALLNYVEKVLGPIIAKYTESNIRIEFPKNITEVNQKEDVENVIDINAERINIQGFPEYPIKSNLDLNSVVEKKNDQNMKDFFERRHHRNYEGAKDNQRIREKENVTLHVDNILTLIFADLLVTDNTTSSNVFGVQLKTETENSTKTNLPTECDEKLNISLSTKSYSSRCFNTTESTGEQNNTVLVTAQINNIVNTTQNYFLTTDYYREETFDMNDLENATEVNLELDDNSTIAYEEIKTTTLSSVIKLGLNLNYLEFLNETTTINYNTKVNGNDSFYTTTAETKEMKETLDEIDEKLVQESNQESSFEEFIKTFKNEKEYNKTSNSTAGAADMYKIINGSNADERGKERSPVVIMWRISHNLNTNSKIMALLHHLKNFLYPVELKEKTETPKNITNNDSSLNQTGTVNDVLESQDYSNVDNKIDMKDNLDLESKANDRSGFEDSDRYDDINKDYNEIEPI